MIVGSAEGITAMPIVGWKRMYMKTERRFGRPNSEIDNERFEKLAQKNKRRYYYYDGLLSENWYQPVYVV